MRSTTRSTLNKKNAKTAVGQMSVREYVVKASYNTNKSLKTEMMYQPDTYLDRRIVSWK